MVEIVRGLVGQKHATCCHVTRLLPHCKACTVAHPVCCGCGLRSLFLICWSLWRWILNHHAKIWGCGNSSIRLRGRRMCILCTWNLQRDECSHHYWLIIYRILPSHKYMLPKSTIVLLHKLVQVTSKHCHTPHVL